MLRSSFPAAQMQKASVKHHTPLLSTTCCYSTAEKRENSITLLPREREMEEEEDGGMDGDR